MPIITNEALSAQAQTIRAAGNDYNIAAVRCPFCPTMFAVLSQVVGALSGQLPQVIAQEQQVTGELIAHLASVHPGVTMGRCPIDGTECGFIPPPPLPPPAPGQPAPLPLPLPARFTPDPIQIHIQSAHVNPSRRWNT